MARRSGRESSAPALGFGRDPARRSASGSSDRTAFDEFIQHLWANWRESGRDFGAFIDQSALELSGRTLGTLAFPGAGRLPWEDPTVRNLDDRPSGEILGESGWRLDLVDGDQSPARHFFGFLALTLAHGIVTPVWALEDNEAVGIERGGSLQDLNSGYAAIVVGARWLFDYPVTDAQFADFIADIEAIAGDSLTSDRLCCESTDAEQAIPVEARPGDGEVIIRAQQEFLTD